ncbi:hypothetical protein L6V77_29015 [Myxococcota bacterium]|nr:hypothetical protein [Myxococcota bacterium]
MRRLLWLVLFFGFLGHATGVFAAAQSDECAESCPDDGPEKHCPPTCTHCVCGAPLAVGVPAVSFTPEPTWVLPECAPDEPLPFIPAAPPPPDPRKLLRVPR